jgi:hypothetical protein
LLHAVKQQISWRVRPGGNSVLTVDAIKTSDDLKKLMISAYSQINSGGFMDGNPLVSADVMADDADNHIKYLRLVADRWTLNGSF